MNKENYPTWLVPLDIARKLKEIGMSNSEILVCNDGYYGWYRNEEIYDYDIDGEFTKYTALEASEWENSNLEPTYTWEQVFEWFRVRGLFSYIRPNMGAMDWYSYQIYDRFDIEKEKGMSFDYENARLFCIEALIEIFKERERNKEKRIMGSITI